MHFKYFSLEEYQVTGSESGLSKWVFYSITLMLKRTCIIWCLVAQQDMILSYLAICPSHVPLTARILSPPNSGGGRAWLYWVAHQEFLVRLGVAVCPRHSKGDPRDKCTGRRWRWYRKKTTQASACGYEFLAIPGICRKTGVWGK